MGLIKKIINYRNATRNIKTWQSIYDLAVTENRRDYAAGRINYWSKVRRANQW